MWDKLGRLHWLLQFLCEGLCFFNSKGFCYLIDLTVYEKGNSSSAWIIFRKFWGFLAGFILCLTFFSHYRPPSSLCSAFDAILSNIYEALLINPSANAFVFRDFKVHQANWLTKSDRIDGPGELCYYFLCYSDLKRPYSNGQLSPTRIPDCDSYILAHSDLSISSDPSICSPVELSLY